ncbi:MAG: 2-oxoacid:ferredoxin oxidoreductase subunit beta, partial [Candidatus Binatia bacterium]
CNVFNDGAWSDLTEKATKADFQLFLEHGKPLVFGKNRDKGIRLNERLEPEVVKLGEGHTESDLIVYDEHNPALAYLLSRLEPPNFPTPIGVFLAVDRPTYEGRVSEQIAAAREKLGAGDVDQLLRQGDTWTVR